MLYALNKNKIKFRRVRIKVSAKDFKLIIF